MVTGFSRGGFGGVGWNHNENVIGTNLNGPLFFTPDGKTAPAAKRSPILANWHAITPDQRPDGSPGIELGDGAHKKSRVWSWSQNGWLAGSGTNYKGISAPLQIWNDQGQLISTNDSYRAMSEEWAAWRPQGDVLVTAGGDMIRFWNPDGTLRQAITAPMDHVWMAEWSPDGQWLASGGFESLIRLWKADGTPGPVLQGQQAGIGDQMAWGPDSKHIVSIGGADRTLRVWNVETGKTEWLALSLDRGDPIVLSPSGQVLHGDRKLLEAFTLYLVEKPDGTTELHPFGEFQKRFAKELIQILSGDLSKALAALDFDRSEALVAEARTFLADGSPELHREVSDLGARLANALFGKHEYARAEPVYRRAIDDLQAALAASDEDPDWQFSLGILWNNIANVYNRTGKETDALAAYTNAIDIQLKLLARFPDRSQYRNGLTTVYSNRADLHRSLHQTDEALSDLDKMIEVNPDSYVAHIGRGLVCSDLGRNDQALAAFSEALGNQKLQTSKEWHARYHSALLRLAVGDLDGYRTDCAAMLRQFQDSQNYDEIQFTAWTCALAPDAVSDWEQVIGLARRAVEVSSARNQSLQGLGAVLFRARRYSEALEVLERANAASEVALTTPAYTWYFLAMTHSQMGHPDEARQWSVKALAATETMLSDSQTVWNRKLTLKFLREETRTLIQPDDANPPADAAAVESANVSPQSTVPE